MRNNSKNITNNVLLDDVNSESNEDIMQKEMSEVVSDEKGVNLE